MSNDSPVLTSLTENSTEVPVSAGRVENYVLLLVLLCVLAGGSLILLSVLLLFCHRCCVGGRRYSRASDDPEKTNTTYVEDSQPTQDITIRLDESDALSASCCHDEETDRFMSTCATGRRVSFNESALYEKESKTQDKGRRYTLTEGDFHHLKKARLTHLPLAPPPSTLKILTIMECESTESSSLNVNEPPAPKLPLYPLYQSSERSAPAWLGQSSSNTLPGDIHHNILLDSRLSHSPPILCPPTPRSRTTEAVGDGAWVRTEGEVEMRGVRGKSLAPGHQGSVLQFFCKLRRHASLEGAGPYFRKWKFDSSHRAASLDAKGSPKRRPFQRQRAASDNADPTEEDSPPLPFRCDIIQPLPHTHSQSNGLQRLSAGSLSPPTCPPSPCLSRLEVEAVVEAASSSSSRTERNATHPPPEPPETQEREQEPEEEATGTGLWREEAGAVTRTEAGEEVNVWVGPGEESDEEEEADILGTEQRVGMGSEIMECMCADQAQEGGDCFQAELGAEARIRARTADGLGDTPKTEAGVGVRAKTRVGAILGTEREPETAVRLESTIEVGETPGAELEVEAGLGTSGVRIKADSGSGLEGVLGAGAGPGIWEDPGPRSRSGSGVCISRQESTETQPSLYRDIWSLRASLEQYASSDQSSTDRESIRSDADSVCSLGGAAARSSFTACLSQDLGDELEGEWEYGDTGREGGDRGQRETEGEAEYRDTGKKIGHRGVQRRDSEGGGGEGGTGETGGGGGEAGSRKLLQMDSGYTSIEAPMRATEELRLFGAPGGPRGKTASERRLFFTSSGRKGTVCESLEAKVFQEELEDEMGKNTEGEEKPVKRSPRSPNGGKTLILKEPPQSVSPLKSLQLQQPPLQSPQPQAMPSPRPVRLRRRDYSIDEKTDALFNEFLRHDPRFDQQESPLRSRHRSRIHLRKQWQRHKQYSDPGSGAGGRYSPSLERQSFRPLRRGDSAGYPLDTRYHSTLSRIASAADEEASEGAAGEGATNEGAACEGAVHESTDVKESTNKGTGNETVANQDTASRSSDVLRAEASGMDPRVDNYNNNSSQALTLAESYSSAPTQNPPVALPKSLKDSLIDPPILHIEDPESSGLNPHPQPQAQAPSPRLSDKLSVTMEDRLYTGLWRTGQGQGGPEYVVGAISLSSSPEPSSPV
ncbi:uncharacterized protein LOC121535477 isoform X1 [Coregonus clupeaformis]|uniref:uncharacterized protein LOC121535477 isoform X1 n=2 Tax=Coregonus clupeaformis TaxID=59861 RepID=UPI001E1C7105|nr:uncharacterized protein LOC121535477 isoform X1 [Coregonus clupeaformis]